jgi:PadR family transcriptional regulator PadR
MAKQSYIGGFELMVMLALMRLGEDAYGVPISREIEKIGRREVALGSVYAALERLEEKGFCDFAIG